jgi:hypothetical protein
MGKASPRMTPTDGREGEIEAEVQCHLASLRITQSVHELLNSVFIKPVSFGFLWFVTTEVPITMEKLETD